MLTKTKMVLEKASLYQNDRKYSLTSRKKHSYEVKHKKRQKCNTRHGKRAYPKTVELNVLTAPRCNVGCQRCKVNVMNELYNVRFMSFDKIEDAMCMPQI